MISSQDENGYITLEFQKLHVIALKTLSQLKSDKVIIALVSTVHVLVALSNFVQFTLPCAHLNPIALIPRAPNTEQNLKVTLIE